ncbi:syndecan isoform X1 [Bactrocera tryoni]|uniref:syndecan isoform X1 n=1 Tax=Bactrocera tryoni TaxID=59916 RepID=UPI001A976B90|nr:syndecan isoform X1 [Bactrocera tryoni]XP_039954527.1 syndecan isoform X1 [Bactrocera tryoni]XP_039954528.1 syndecan isoform X1 [Bactrocera tryoni]XP_039954529.1 syndecan isoform X1 [Bactrocera tryoni]XP_039954530.1 syndecan isoform X1 [Bactrocera tryoni]XP_039954531.1 syndecan isoform X1 [Bactrocera tryoni]XP_039954532.1 syndecan isoform X1 [Bactrocera tryoni]
MCNIYKNASPTSTTWIATSSATSGSEMTAGKQRAAGCILTSLTPTHVTTSGSRKFLLAVALFVLLASVNGATDQKTVKPSPTSPLSSSSASLSATPKDEIYIDDESIEGSGGRGGLHDDLDKDPDYSGSGFGPDDEDSSTDLQPSHRGNNIHTQSGKHNTVLTTDDNDDLITSRTHHQTNSGTIIGSNSGSNSGIIGGNSGSNTGLNTIATTTKQTSPSTTTTNQNTPTLTHITTTTSSATAGKNRGSYLYPNQVQQTHLPAAPHYPAGGAAHTDDEDFDLGEGDDDDAKQQLGGAGSFAGSGDGDRDDDDDDHTGDVDDDDEHEVLIERPHQPKNDFGLGKEPTAVVENGTNTSSTTASSTTTTTGSSSGSNDHKAIFSSSHDEDEHVVDADEEDEFDDTYDEDNKDDDEDDEDGRVHEEDDNTEVYIDGTEPNTKSGGSVDQDIERGTTNQGNTIHELDTNNVNSQPTDTKVIEHTTGNEVLIMNTSDDDRTASFFAQPGILAAVIGGAVVGLLCAILVVMFIVYRMRKKDEGSYALDEPKRSPAVNSYAKNANNREFYA